MTDPAERRSRIAWPGPMSTAGVGEGHQHELPNPLVKRVRLLTAALFIVGGCVAAIVVLVMLLIFQRGEQRDEETQRLREEIRISTCSLLDTFPEGVPALERARTKYGCGPGIPIGLLTPEERERIGPRPTPVPADPTVPLAPVPPLGSAASPDAPRIAPNMPGPGNTAPQPSPEPGPVVDPEPVTDLVCDLAGLCL